MINLIGIALTCVVIIFCFAIVVKSIKERKIVSLLIVLFIFVFYYITTLNNLTFKVLSTILLIPQIIFVTFVIFFFFKSIFKKKNKSFKSPLRDENLPFFSILIATHNEENVIEKTVSHLQNLSYDKSLYDITIVDDLSTDNTLNVLKNNSNKINLIDRKLLYEKVTKKGKAAAINDVIDSLKGDLVLVLDADCLPEKEILLKVYKYFQDENIGVVQCRNTFYNERNNFVSLLTSIDIYSVQYAMYVPMSMLGFGMFEGRAGIFRKSIFKKLKGFDEILPGEDYDFTYRVALAGFRVVYDENITSSEQVTETLQEWFIQRKRWLGNHVLSFFKNSKHLYKSDKLNKRKKISMSFILFNLLFFFLFNFHGPLILLNEFSYHSSYSLIFVGTFILAVTLFIIPYFYHSKKLYLIVFIPFMIIYYWLFSIIETWVFINEKILKINLLYKKASHRKPLVNEI